MTNQFLNLIIYVGHKFPTVNCLFCSKWKVGVTVQCESNYSRTFYSYQVNSIIKR